MDDREVTTFVQAFAALVDHALEAPAAGANPVVARLAEHLGADPLEQPIVGATFAPFEHPDVQLAIDAYLADAQRSVTAFGMSGDGRRHMDFGELLGARHFDVGPVVRTDVPVDVDTTMACIEFAFLMVAGTDDPPHVIVVRMDAEQIGSALVVEVMSRSDAHASAVLDDLRDRMRSASVYRGKVFTLSQPDDEYERSVGVTFLRRPAVPRGAIVLPDGLLERVERRTIDFDAVADVLAAQGLARKRGILLYGPPGTGKTLTVRHLIGRLADRTTVVLTGMALGAIGPAASLARRLEPSLLVLEDVDLIAQERDYGYENPLLFELLNELDGIGEDADVVALLTTNRADLLEPALASRPGRVDLAVELPLPGEDEQRRLLELYSRGVDTDIADWAPVVERIVGTPASFVRELIRTAALHAAAEGAPVVALAHVERGITELLDSGPVTPRLLGIGAIDLDDDIEFDAEGELYEDVGFEDE